MPRDELNQDLCDDDLGWIQTVLDRGREFDRVHAAYIGHQTGHHTHGAQAHHDTMARAGKISEHLSQEIKIIEDNMTNLLIGIGWKAETDINHGGSREFRIVPWNPREIFGSDQEMANAMTDVSKKTLVDTAIARSKSIL